MSTNRAMCKDVGRAMCALGTIGLAALAGACSYSNDRNDLGGGYAGLEPGVVLRGLDAPSAGVPGESGQANPDPSAVAADPNRPALDLARSNWPQRTFMVPVTAIAGGPTYTSPHHTIDAAARDRGQYPTPTSALELSPNDYWSVAADAWAAAPFAVWDMLLAPYDAIVAAGPDWRQPERRGPIGAYSRAPAWTSRGVPTGSTRGDELPPATPGDGVPAGHLPNPLD